MMKKDALLLPVLLKGNRGQQKNNKEERTISAPPEFRLTKRHSESAVKQLIVSTAEAGKKGLTEKQPRA